MFYALGIFFISFILLMLIYTVSRFRKFYFLSKISNKKLSWIISLLPFIFFGIYILYDSINGILVLLYFSLFSLLFDFIFFILKKISKRDFKYYISGICAVIVTILYLSNAYYLAHNVIRTDYLIRTNKEIGTDKFRIAQISDSHIGATMDGDDFINYMKKINKSNPDIVVVTGDFVDDDTTKDDMIKGCIGLGNLKSKYGVYYINGNHDAGYFNKRDYSYNELKDELKKNNVKILEDEYAKINDYIYIVGRIDRRYLERKKIEQLVKDIDNSKYIIDLNHQPNDYENEKNAKVDLVLSGHTHGGQLFPLGPLGVLAGFNDNYYGFQKRGDTSFIVNSGLGDWAIKFKTGTVSEYGIIDIVKNNN